MKKQIFVPRGVRHAVHMAIVAESGQGVGILPLSSPLSPARLAACRPLMGCRCCAGVRFRAIHGQPVTNEEGSTMNLVDIERLAGELLATGQMNEDTVADLERILG